MIFQIFALALMVAAHLFYSRDLDGRVKLAFWATFLGGWVVLTGLLHAPYLSALFGAAVALVYLVKGHTASNHSGEI